MLRKLGTYMARLILKRKFFQILMIYSQILKNKLCFKWEKVKNNQPKEKYKNNCNYSEGEVKRGFP